jgi:protein CpxP
MMSTRCGRILALATGALFLFAPSLQPTWADPDSKGKESGHERGYGKEGYGGHGMGMGRGMMMHGSTSHLLRHMLKHEKEIGLKEDQVAKLKEMQLNLDKTRIRAEADIMIAQREIKAMVEDEKSDLSAIEAKLKQSEDLEVALRMAAIKTRRDAMALLTPEQREKQKAEHEKMMEQHRSMGGQGEGYKERHKKDDEKDKS